MSKPTKVAILCLGILAGSLIPLAESSAQNKVGTTAAPFLTIGVGSRPLGMGGAFVSIADDGNALYWNPAGIARMSDNEIILVHSDYLAGTSFEFVGAVLDMQPIGVVGFSATMLDIGEMEVTTVMNQEGTGLFFRSYDAAAAVHYGYMFYDHFFIGGTAKYIQLKSWNESAEGFAIDVGTLFITPIRDTRLGMSIANFGTRMRMEGRDLFTFYDPDKTKQGNNDRVISVINSDEWALPLTLRLGVSNELIDLRPHRLTLALDWVVPNDNTEHLNIGGEYAYDETYFLRTGYRALRPGNHNGSFSLVETDNGNGATFGGGVNLKVTGMLLSVDFAYESYNRLGSVYKYSLGLKF